MARTRRRKSKEFLLFHERTTLGWSVVARISYEQGERRVDQRSARRVVDCNGKHIGYQNCDPEFIRDQMPVVMRSMASITAAEIELLAGTAFRRGGSRTASMSEARRQNRFHPKSGKLLPAEDRVERVIAKVQAFGEARLVAG